MARDTDKRAHRKPWPFGALAGRYPSIEIEDIKAARREALLGIDRSTHTGGQQEGNSPRRTPTIPLPRKPL
jgi:hypothetical protein